jgi:hypothetical protein
MVSLCRRLNVPSVLCDVINVVTGMHGQPVQTYQSTSSVTKKFTVVTGKRQWTLERNVIGHTPARFKRAGVGSNGILESVNLCRKRAPYL